VKEEYRTMYHDCKKRPCFVPFSGNGVKVCRLFELGQCKNKPVKDPRRVELMKLSKGELVDKLLFAIDSKESEAKCVPVEVKK